MLAESGVSVAYRSDAVRAARIFESFKQTLGAALTIEEVGFPGTDGVEFHIASIVEKIKALPANAVVAVVSHSNTVGPILEGLGSGPVATIKETEFDRLFVLFIRAGGSPALIKMRYGSAT